MNDFSLLTAVVTGAASGFGRAIALLLAQQGYAVALVDLDRAGLDETARQVTAAGGVPAPFCLDVASIEQIENLADQVYSLWGKVDLLVNNAGIAAAGDVGDMPIEHWRAVVDVNYWGVVNGCQVFVPRMKLRKRGHIVNMASIAGMASPPGFSAYSSTKAAVISLSETLCLELAPYRIGVTVVCPAFFKTNNIASMVENRRYTSPWQRLVCEAAENAAPSVEVVAQRVLNAVKKNKLYAAPQGRAKAIFLLKRMVPSLGMKAMALLIRSGKLEQCASWLAVRGWL